MNPLKPNDNFPVGIKSYSFNFSKRWRSRDGIFSWRSLFIIVYFLGLHLLQMCQMFDFILMRWLLSLLLTQFLNCSSNRWNYSKIYRKHSRMNEKFWTVHIFILILESSTTAIVGALIQLTQKIFAPHVYSSFWTQYRNYRPMGEQRLTTKSRTEQYKRIDSVKR